MEPSHNRIDGDVFTAVQADQIHGDIHIHRPAEAKQAPPGRPLHEVVDPFRLEVHHAISSVTAELPVLPRYVPRSHDHLLADVVARAANGISQIAVLVGGSSTGKTRACWEALHLLRSRPEPWRLWHPIDPTHADAALAGLPHVRPHTVLWLNEAQFYLTDERVAAGLRALLADPARGPVLILATLWPEHWNTLTDRSQHAQARELLTDHKINLPDAFLDTDLASLVSSTDPRLAEAAQRAGDGQITQYLAGVPLLIDRYQSAPPITQAFIHAAMDARRLGAGPRLPLAWLAEAAPGYLTDAQWDQTSDEWLHHALSYVTEHCNGIPGILTAVKAPRNRRTPATHENGSQYRLADYLEQYGREHRADTIPPTDFWTTAVHAHPADLPALAEAADTRGLYRDAAQLLKHAAVAGNAFAAFYLVRRLHDLQPGDLAPASWAASHVTLKDPHAIAELLTVLSRAEAHDQIAALMDRKPATHVVLGKSDYAVDLLKRLREAGAHDQFKVLAERVIPNTVADSSIYRWSLFLQLHDMGAHDQVAALADQAVAAASLNAPDSIRELLRSMHYAGAFEQMTTLLDRIAADAVSEEPNTAFLLLETLGELGTPEQTASLAEQLTAKATHYPSAEYWNLVQALRKARARKQFIMLATARPIPEDPNIVRQLLYGLHEAGAHQHVNALAEHAVAHIALTDADAMADLLSILSEVDAHDQITDLLARAPADQVLLADPEAVTRLLAVLLRLGAVDQVAALVNHDPAGQACLADPAAVVRLLDILHQVGAYEQVDALLARVPASHVDLDDTDGLVELLRRLHEAREREQVTALADRIVVRGPFNLQLDVDWDLLWAVQDAGAREQYFALLGEAAAHAPLHMSHAVIELLSELQAVEANEHIAVLLARDPVTEMARYDPELLPDLLQLMDGHQQLATLVERLPTMGLFNEYLEMTDHPERYRYGREPDGSPAAPWGWEDLV